MSKLSRFADKVAAEFQLLDSVGTRIPPESSHRLTAAFLRDVSHAWEWQRGDRLIRLREELEFWVGVWTEDGDHADALERYETLLKQARGGETFEVLFARLREIARELKGEYPIPGQLDPDSLYWTDQAGE